jgi:hypothetical protein
MKTLDRIVTYLEPNQIFVFGSNLSGIHGAGAARTARRWGAKMGLGEGISGKTYALPTVDKKIKNTLTLPRIKKHVEKFIECVENNPHMEFLLTDVGCGLAGYDAKEVAPLFKEAKDLPNITWPKSFVEVLNEDR